MINPWLTISHSDYEGHMLKTGQAQVLNELTKNCLDKYKPETFALLGCSTGNLRTINDFKKKPLFLSVKFLTLLKSSYFWLIFIQNQRFLDRLPLCVIKI